MANRILEYERDLLGRAVSVPRSSMPGVQERFKGVVNEAAKWIVANPEVAVTAAVVSGVVLGWWIKRR